MKMWQKCLLAVLAVSLIAGARIYFVHKAREDPGVFGHKAEEPRPTMDQLAVVRQYIFSSFEDAKQLEGKPVWVKAGYSLPYYAYAGGQVVFGKHLGELPSAEKLEIVKLVKAVAPAKEVDRVPHGSRQFFAVFTMGGKPGQWAAPIGYAEGGDEKMLCDLLFYYDDPKTIYDDWPKAAWEAVAAHEARVGLTENQTRMAVGMLMEPNDGTEGNRTVTYHANEKTWTVTFVKGLATVVKAG